MALENKNIFPGLDKKCMFEKYVIPYREMFYHSNHE